MVIKTVSKLLIALELSVLLFGGCSRQKVTTLKQSDKISVNMLLASFFEIGLDSILNESNKNTIVFANDFMKDSLAKLHPSQNNIILFTDTLTFNKILKDSSLLNFMMPIYVKSSIENDTTSLLLFKHNKEAIYNIRFKKEINGKLKYIDNSITYVKFKYALPYNNQK